MKYWFRLFLLIGTLLLIVWVIGSLLPRNYDFSAEIQIDQPADVVFAELNQLSNWHNWSQWNPQAVQGLDVKYTGPESGEGATQSWRDVRGNGKLWFTKTQPNQSIEYEMLFANFPQMTGQLTLTEISVSPDAKTKVVWSSKGRLPSGAFYGFFASIFPRQMKMLYEDSLGKLKSKLETKPKLESEMIDGPKK